MKRPPDIQPQPSEARDCQAEFIEHRCQIMSLINALVRDPHEAEDIFQEVWIQLRNALEKKVEIENTVKWCRGVVRNLVRHYWQQQSRRDILVDDAFLDRMEQVYSDRDTESDYWNVRSQAMKECLGQLSEKSRELLKLRYEEGLSFEEMTRRCLRTSTSLRMTISRLRASLVICAQKKLKSLEAA